MRALDGHSLEELDKLLAGASRFGIVVHSHPDGDALGSAFALASYLRECRHSQVSVVLPDAYPHTLDFLVADEDCIVASEDMASAVAALQACDMLICLDLNGFSRTAGLQPVLEELSCTKLLIDHHVDPQRDSFDLVFSETEISSSCELLYYILLQMHDVGDASRLPLRAGNCLMTGMTTDTNNFANSVFPSTFEMASQLLAAGVDREKILHHLYRQYRENRYRALGLVCSKLLKITQDGVAYVVLRRHDWQELGLMEGETEGFVNIALEMAAVNMSIFLREDEGHFRVSIRSKSPYSARLLAAEFFNGGGHECAAGGKLYCPGDIASADEAENYIEIVTARFLHRNGRPNN